MIEQLLNRINEAKETIYNQILSLPQNEKITNVTESPNTFTIQFKDIIGKPFSPYYHDFKAQYKLIVESLQNARIENFESKLREILDQKKLVVNKQTYLLAPEVISYIERLQLIETIYTKAQHEQLEDVFATFNRTGGKQAIIGYCEAIGLKKRYCNRCKCDNPTVRTETHYRCAVCGLENKLQTERL